MKFEDIKELIEIFSESDLGQLKLKEKDFSIEMQKGGGAVTVQNITSPAVQATAPAQIESSSAPAAPIEEESKAGELIVSPMVGTFYAAPSPDSPPFVKVGDTVRKGQTLCILEAMKIMNEVEAEYDCKILEVLVEDGEPVEYDKPLFRVEKL